ncbi:hypothetical protein WJX72_006401 [[Myrmecia] bisecta]|uniref:WD repeat-containing protein 90 n=1 Tax=[Myrmecia] bisecta TaxID=41462 RepID=A0AAW1QRQ3_9CHLO
MRLASKVWQHPFVDVFKLCRVEQWPRADANKHGDATAELDRSIGKLVLRIGGSVSAANYVQLPKARAHSLGLTGRYLYCQVQFAPAKCFVFHIDVLTADKNTVRISIGNLFKSDDNRRNKSGIQLPYPEPTDKWTVLALDLPEVLAAATSSPYQEVKAIQMCATMSARNFFTSDCVYKLETLPREMAFSHAKPLDSFHFEWLCKEPQDVTPRPEIAAMPNESKSPAKSPTKPLVHVVASTLFAEPPSALPNPQDRLDSALPAAAAVPEPNILQPDPALELERINGYTGEYTRLMLWAPNSPEVVFAAASTIVVMNVNTGTQRYLFGHTNNVCGLAANAQGTLLASAEEGRLALIRLWDLPSGRCLAILNGHAGGMICLDVSPDGRSLLAVGLDTHAKQQIVLWDISKVPAGQKARVVTKHVTDYNIKCARFSPYEPDRLVACGKNSIRMYRLKAGTLRGMSINLGPAEVKLAPLEGPDLGANVFTDVAFETGFGLLQLEERHVFVSSVSGAVYQVNYGRRVLERIYQLHTGAINALLVNEGFCITASDDKFLRIWPVDFSDFLLEAEHEAPVTAVGVGPDGLRMAIGTENGSVGVLDVPTHQYATLLRSHTDAVNAVAKDPNREEMCTVSADGTIRVWDLPSHQQIYEFDAPGEVVLCCAYHPLRRHIACGFDNGKLRVFDVVGTSLVQEHRQHRGAVTHLLFAPNGDCMFSLGAEGNLCVYNVAQDYLPIKYLQTSPPDRHNSIAISADSRVLAATAYEPDQDHVSILLFQGATLEPLQRIQPVCEALTAMAFAPDNRSLWALTTDRRMLQFSLHDGKLVRQVANTHRTGCEALAIDSRQRFLATGGQDHLIKLWVYPAEGSTEPLASQSFVGHSEGVSGICFTDTHLISVGPGDATFTWRLRPPETPLPPLPPQSAPVSPSRPVHTVEEWHASQEGSQAGSPSPQQSPSTSRLSTATSWDPFLGLHRRTTGGISSPNMTSAAAAQFAHLGVRTSSEGGLPTSTTFQGIVGFNGSSSGSAVWCPTTRTLAYAADNVVLVEQPGHEQRQFRRHTEPVCCLAMAPDGAVLASAAPAAPAEGANRADAGSRDGTICLWDVPSSTCARVMHHHPVGVQAMSFSPDGVWLASIGRAPERALGLWDVASGSAIAVGQVQQPVEAVSWRNNTALPEFMTVGQGGAMLWVLEPSHLAQHHLVLPPQLAAAGCTAVCCSLDDTMVVGTAAGTVWQLAVSTSGAVSGCRQLCAVPGAASAAVTHLQMDKDRMCIGSASGVVAVFVKQEDGTWRAETSMSLDESPAAVTSLSVDASLSRAVVATSAATIWDVDMHQGSKAAIVTAHAHDVLSLAAAAWDPALLASTSADGLLRIFSARQELTAQAVALYEYRSPQACTAAHFVSDNRHCAGGYEDGRLRLFGLRAGEGPAAQECIAWTVERHQSAIVALASSPDGSRLLSASRDGILAVTDTATGALVMRSQQLAQQPWPLDGLALAPADPSLCAGAWADHLAVFSTPWAESKCRTVGVYQCGEAQGRPAGEVAGRGMLAFGPAGSVTVLYTSPFLQGQVVFFDYRQSCVTRTVLLSSQITALSASLGNTLIAAATAAGGISLMHLGSGQTLELEGHSRSAQALQFAGQRLYAASGKCVSIWEMEADGAEGTPGEEA